MTHISNSTQLAPQWRIYCHESLKVAKKGTFEGRFWPPPQISKPFHLKEYKIEERYLQNEWSNIQIRAKLTEPQRFAKGWQPMAHPVYSSHDQMM